MNFVNFFTTDVFKLIFIKLGQFFSFLFTWIFSRDNSNWILLKIDSNVYSILFTLNSVCLHNEIIRLNEF